TEGGAKIPNIEWKSLAELSQSWEEIPSPFEILEQRHRAQSKGSIPWDTWVKVLSEMESRLEKLSGECQKLTRDKNLDPHQLFKSLKLLRDSALVLANNSFFISFVLELNAASYLRIENGW